MRPDPGHTRSDGSNVWSGSVLAGNRRLGYSDLRELCDDWTSLLIRNSVDRLRLREIDLANNPLGEGTVPMLCTWLQTNNVTIEVIKMFKCGLTNDAITSVARYMDWCATDLKHAVEELHLSDNEMEQAGFRALLDAVVKNEVYPAGDRTVAATGSKGGGPRRAMVRNTPLWLRVDNNRIKDPEKIVAEDSWIELRKAMVGTYRGGKLFKLFGPKDYG